MKNLKENNKKEVKSIKFRLSANISIINQLKKLKNQDTKNKNKRESFVIKSKKLNNNLESFLLNSENDNKRTLSKEKLVDIRDKKRNSRLSITGLKPELKNKKK